MEAHMRNEVLMVGRDGLVNRAGGISEEAFKFRATEQRAACGAGRVQQATLDEAVEGRWGLRDQVRCLAARVGQLRERLAVCR